MLDECRHPTRCLVLFGMITWAVMLVSATVSAASGGKSGPLFPLLPAPSPLAEPRPAAEVVPDAAVSSTRAWSCRDDESVIAHHGAEEADLLLRLTGVVELSLEDRYRLLRARGELRESLCQAVAATRGDRMPLPDPLLAGHEQYQRIEEDLLAELSARLADQQVCAGTEQLVVDALTVAETMEITDALSVSLQGAVQDFVGRQLVERSLGRSSVEVEAAVDHLIVARDALAVEETAWFDRSSEVSALLARQRRYRAMVAVLYSEHLAEIEDLVRDQKTPESELAADVLISAVIRAREYASRSHPSFISAAPSFLDVSGLAVEAPRRLAAERIVAGLRLQLPLLADLHRVSSERAELVAAANVDGSLGEGIDYLGEMLADSWYRLSRVAELLTRDDLSDLERAWCWTEIGRLRDRVLSLERMNVAVDESRGLWDGEGDPSYERSLEDLVRREELLMAQIEAIKEGESPEIVAFDRLGEQLAAATVTALDGLIQEADVAIESSASSDSRRAATAMRVWLEAYRATLLAGLPDGGPLAEIAEPLRTLAGETALPFAAAADGLRSLPEMDRIVEGADQATTILRRLPLIDDPREVDRTVLQLSITLGVPLRPDLAAGELLFVLQSGQISYTVRYPLPIQDIVPASSRYDPWWRAVGVSQYRYAGNGGDATPFWERPSKIPPEWDRPGWERVAVIPENIGNEVYGSLWVYGTCAVVAAIPFPPTQLAAGKVFAGTLIKDVITGSAKGLADAAFVDPRDREALKRAFGWGRWATDVIDIGTGYGDWQAAEGAEKAAQAMQLGAGIGDTFKGTVQNVFPGGEEPFPYAENIAKASLWIGLALEKAKVCIPADWVVIKGYLDQASVADSFRQAHAWAKVGDTLMELANTCPDKLAPFGDTDPIDSALKALDNQLRACNPVTARAKLNQCRSPVYTALRRCLCRHDFNPELDAAEIVLAELELGLALRDSAEASCDPGKAAALAAQLVDWSDANSSLFDCAVDIRARADELTAWAAGATGEEAAADLAEARREIEACHLDAAETILAAQAAPTRCVDTDPQGAEIRRDLLARVSARREDDAKFEAIASSAAGALERCDTEWARTALTDLDALEPCADGQNALVQSLQSFVDHGNADDGALARLEPEATRALTTCDTQLAQNLLSQIEALKPCLEENLNRQTELADRLRFFTEQGSDAEGDDQLLAQAQEEFNRAVYGADRACDMTEPRHHLELAREILFNLATSPCRSPYLDTFDQLVDHGQFVEEKIQGREALMQSIRTSAAAGEAAFDAAVVSCDAADLALAVAHAGDAIRIADSVPIINGEGCAEIVRVADEAKGLRDEATTLMSYWSAVDSDLASARQAAADGRTADVGAFCASVRQSAHPVSCFSDALSECDVLGAGGGPSQPIPITSPGVTTGSTSSTSASSSAAGGGSGRVEIMGAETCAKDMHWVPAKQRFECTCPGYRFDANLARCVPGGATAAQVSQADCDTKWPGTQLRQDPATGQWACKCPTGSGWSEIQNGCLSLATGSGQAADGDCSHMAGTMYDRTTGRCRCTVGSWDEDQKRCVDTAAAERDRRIAEGQRSAECERVYSDLLAFSSRSEPIYQQMAAQARAKAASLGCDPARVASAVAGSGRFGTPSSTGSGRGSGTGSPTRQGTGGESGGGSANGQASGTNSGGGSAGTCHFIDYGAQGDAYLVYEQQAQGNHTNVYVIPITSDGDDDDEAAVRAHWDGLPGYRFVGRFTNAAEANAAARRVCEGKSIV